MSARGLMITGASVSAVAMFGVFVGIDTGGTAVMFFAGGALFGKGYGIWESRP